MPPKLRRFLFGAPRDVKDPQAFHKMSLVALLAWVGLGADGLSSSAYGPDEAFRTLGDHTGLAVFLAIGTALTVFIISYGYSRIIERFPSGGGGYVVASQLLGPKVGVVSGAALLVDYVLTITISIAFSLSNLAMTLYWVRHRRQHPDWRRHLPAHVAALLLCATILLVTILEKFAEGGWMTLVITSALVLVCFLVKRHYNLVGQAIRKLDRELPSPEEIEGAVWRSGSEDSAAEEGPDPREPIAILFVGSYGGLGRHALLTLLRMFPGRFQGVVFASIALVDSDVFKGADQVQALEARTREHLRRYERLARVLGLRAASTFSIGTEVAVEAERIGIEQYKRYPRALVVAGQLIFQEETLFTRALHNETAFAIQKRLQHIGVPMIVIPVRLNLAERRPERPVEPPAIPGLREISSHEEQHRETVEAASAVSPVASPFP